MVKLDKNGSLVRAGNGPQKYTVKNIVDINKKMTFVTFGIFIRDFLRIDSVQLILVSESLMSGSNKLA